MGAGAFDFDSEREGLDWVFDPTCFAVGDGPIEVELGSLVAALSAAIEDETELELCLRTVVESGAFRLRVGDGKAIPEAVPTGSFEAIESSEN